MGPIFPWWGGMWLFPIIMPVVMLLFSYLVVQHGGFRPPWQDYPRRYPERGDAETPLQILRRRYAQGEITKDEFEQMKEDLNLSNLVEKEPWRNGTRR